MSDHLKRLREAVAWAEKGGALDVGAADIAALLADYDEAVAALRGALHALRESDAADVWEEETDAVRAVLAKAGGK